jgi:SAM-dependent methyltransferase
MANSNQPVPSIAGRVSEWAAVARAMIADGQSDKAVKLAIKIRESAGDDPEAAGLVSELLSTQVPKWHFNLVRDVPRNDAFEAALRRAMKPGIRVLDIGTGTGLLAMMAARAGAAEVFACEMNQVVADAAKQVIAKNGFADRIKVLPKPSTQLNAEQDLGGPVDLIVSEIVSNDLLDEAVLPTMEHATAHLLKPGGQLIPAKGSIRVALAFDAGSGKKCMDVASGFDLTPFNYLAEPRYHIHTTSPDVRLMSEPAEVFVFDFGAADRVPGARKELSLVAQGGPVNCVVQWIQLQLDETGEYENKPGEPKYSTWDAYAYPLSKPIESQPGQRFIVNCSHDRFRVRIWMPGE